MSRFFNTLTGKLDELKPLREGAVGIYTCGPTVYDYAHIGNFRAFVFEDLLRRYLESAGLEVRHVMNLTDVDDKTIAGANRERKSLHEYTEFYTQAFLEDLRVLNILPPSVQPRATQEIAGMILLIEKLIAAKIAYESEGSVYYRVAAFPGYGKLSKKKLEKNIEGARVDVDEYDKEQGADFVLWKKSKDGEPFWESPWGKGRPGWHIECSVMSMKYLGETFDIHAGGEDLIFPHHENEIAQSEAATGKPFVNYWMHCKFLLVNGEKMSKSKGNFYTLRDLLTKGYDPMAIRYLLLSTHYRSPLNFTLEGLKEAGETVKKLDDCYFQCLSLYDDKNLPAGVSAGMARQLGEIFHKMMGWLGDDLNISGALTELIAAVTLINKECAKLSKEDLAACLEFFRKTDVLLGFDAAFVERVPAEVMKRMASRLEVRRRPDFKTDRGVQKQSDEMRAEIEKLGWLVKDARPGEPSTVKKKRRTWD